MKVASTKATLQIVSTDTAGNKSTTNIAYVNPNASDVALKELGQKLNALTDNTLVEVNKVVTTNISAASYEYSVQTASTDVTVNLIDQTTSVTLVTNIDSDVSVQWSSNSPSEVINTINRIGDTSGFECTFTSGTAGTYTITVYPTVDGMQIANSLTFNVTVEE